MSNDDFIELVVRLQSMGATFVKAGDLEVVLGAQPVDAAWEFSPREKEEDGTAAHPRLTRQFILDHYGSAGGR